MGRIRGIAREGLGVNLCRSLYMYVEKLNCQTHRVEVEQVVVGSLQAPGFTSYTLLEHEQVTQFGNLSVISHRWEWTRLPLISLGLQYLTVIPAPLCSTNQDLNRPGGKQKCKMKREL